MNKSLTVNIGGLAFIIDDSAYNELDKYLKDVRASMQDTPDVDEIMKDVEGRIAELFREYLGPRQVIDESDVKKMIKVMGTPEQFVEEDIYEDEIFQSKKTKKAEAEAYRTGKKLYRDMDNKIIGGVCAGLGNYFGINPNWIRLIFLLPLFLSLFDIGMSFFTMGIIYLILWVIIPPAKTTAEKLEMYGKPVNFNSIKDYVNIDNKEINDNINKFSDTAKEVGNSFGDFLEKLFKVIGKIAIVFFGIILLMMGIGGLAAVFIGILPMSFTNTFHQFGSMVMDNKGDQVLAVISLSFIIIIPAILCILLGLKLLSPRFKFTLTWQMLLGALILWFISIGIFTYTMITTAMNFQDEASKTTNSEIVTKSDTIQIGFKNFNNQNYKFSKNVHWGFNGDMFGKDFNVTPEGVVSTVWRDINIKKSTNGKVIFEIQYSSDGKNPQEALSNIQITNFKYEIKNNQIWLDEYILFPKSAKFRNQQVEFTLYVPEGKIVNVQNAYKVVGYEKDESWGNQEDFYEVNNNSFTFAKDNFKCLDCPKDDNEEVEEEIDVYDDVDDNSKDSVIEYKIKKTIKIDTIK